MCSASIKEPTVTKTTYCECGVIYFSYSRSVLAKEIYDYQIMLYGSDNTTRILHKDDLEPENDIVIDRWLSPDEIRAITIDRIEKLLILK